MNTAVPGAIGRIRAAGWLWLVLALGAATQARAAGCEESCLTALAERYLQALVAHAPGQLPTTKDVRFTENTVELPYGAGLWTTASALKAYRHVIADPESGQVGLYAAIEENGVGALLVARLKLRADRVSELETLVVRAGDMGSFLKTDALEPAAGFGELVPVAQRATRQELIRIANLYFEGLEQSSGDIVPFSEHCRRFENGTQTAGQRPVGSGPAMTLKLADGRSWEMPSDCRASFNTRMFSYISRIDHRRFEIIDRSRGVVMAFVMFQHEGNVKEAEVPGVGKVAMPPSAQRPFSVVIAEAFEIKEGRIREIEADMTKLPYGAGTGWAP